MVTIYCQLSLKVLNFSVLLVLSIMHVSRDLTAEALNHRIAQRGEREERGGGPAAVAVRRPSHALTTVEPGGASQSAQVWPCSLLTLLVVGVVVVESTRESRGLLLVTPLCRRGSFQSVAAQRPARVHTER